MASDLLFEEVQGTRKEGAVRFFRVTAALFGLALAFNLVRQSGAVSEVTTGLILGTVLCILLSIFSDSGMTTQVRTDGIYVRLKPFHPSFVQYAWKDIQQVAISQYNPFEYGGLGIRRGPMGLGYIAIGNTAIHLVLQNGQKVLVTTQQPQEVAEVLRRLGRL